MSNNDDSFFAFESPHQIIENHGGDSSDDNSISNGNNFQSNRNIFGGSGGIPARNKQKTNPNHDSSILSLNTLVNIQQFEEQHLIEIKIRLEEEMVKNEHLESKLRSIEFEHMIKINELNRRVQELELKNNNLFKQLQEQDKASTKNIYPTNNIINNNVNDSIKTPSANRFGVLNAQNNSYSDVQKQEFNLQFEEKLIQYENEILMLKQREADLLGQMNTVKQENFDLKMKTERMSFFAQRDSNIGAIAANLNQQSPSFNSGRKTFSLFKQPQIQTPQRQTSANLAYSKVQSSYDKSSSQSISNPNTIQVEMINMHPSQLKKAYLKHQQHNNNNEGKHHQQHQQRLTFSLQNHQIGVGQASQRVSVISAISQFAQINNANVNVDQVNELHEARQLIIQISTEKESLEDELQAVKDRAIAKIEEKEFQIIDLIKQHEDYVDQLKRESQKLQLEVQNQKRTDRWREDQDDQINLLQDREISQLKQELQNSEDKYEKLYQKYLEERRQFDNEAAFLQDKYQKDMDYYLTKINKQKDKIRILTKEMEKLKHMILQNQDFKSEIVKEIEDYELRLREHENEKQQIERDFLDKIDTKNQIIQEKQNRIKQLQDELFRIEDTIKQSMEEESQQQTDITNELRDQILVLQRSINEFKMEIDTLQSKNFKLSDQVNELNAKKKTLNDMIVQMQQQRKEAEANYEFKIDNLDKKISNQTAQYQQQITSLRMHIDFLENGGFNNGVGMSDQKLRENNLLSGGVEDERTRNSTQQDANYHTGTFNTQSTFGNNTPPKNIKQNEPLPLPVQSLMEELCDDNLSQRFSQFQSPYHGLRKTSNYYNNISPRQSNFSQSQFYGYNQHPANQYENDYRNSCMSPYNGSNRPTYIQRNQNINIDSQRPSINEQLVTRNSNISSNIQVVQQNKYPNIFRIKLNTSSIIDEKKDEQENQENQSSESDEEDAITQLQEIQEQPEDQEIATHRKNESDNEEDQLDSIQIQMNIDPKLLEEMREQQIKDADRIEELENLLFLRENDIQSLNEQLEELRGHFSEKEEILNEFQDQIDLYQKEIELIKQSKEQLSDDFKKQLEKDQKQYKDLVGELQAIRKQNMQMKNIALTYNTQLQQAQNTQAKEVILLKRKVRSLEDQNEELVEQIMTQKQQYSQEKNYLRIQISQVEESLIQLKLTHAQMTMEKDLINVKYKESIKQTNDLKEKIKKVTQASGNSFRWNATLRNNESVGNSKLTEPDLSIMNLSFNRTSMLESENGGCEGSGKQRKIFDWNLNFQ
ncbi:UNKNOWN [Stylonychia lemnae]|uniref:Uncharacterized protein n=1 Tax=Stylonychia lemnae TaxID=5949 RepID=A0A078A3A1_STYLE|nr:UNKNOWN [Stylonychia lemnae]|eukprot:CDW76753.1 UNKNOWN [Stylonychia lemnae]